MTPRKFPRSLGARFAVLVATASGFACSSENPWDHGTPRPTPADAPQKPAALEARAPSNGFGDAIAWQPLTEGIATARVQNRPLMLVVHASWCRSCRALKPAFEDRELAKLTRDFVMVNVDQDEDPSVRAYAIDGTYVPRVVFVDPKTGEPIEDLRNPSRHQSLYYYSPHDDLLGVMKKAIARYASDPS